MTRITDSHFNKIIKYNKTILHFNHAIYPSYHWIQYFLKEFCFFNDWEKGWQAKANKAIYQHLLSAKACEPPNVDELLGPDPLVENHCFRACSHLLVSCAPWPALVYLLPSWLSRFVFTSCINEANIPRKSTRIRFKQVTKCEHCLEMLVSGYGFNLLHIKIKISF